METPAPLYAADRFTSIIEELCRVLTRHGRAHLIAAPILMLIWNRLIRMAKQFARIAARVHAGTPAPPARPRSHGAATREPRATPAETLPQHFRWLVNMLPEAGALCADLCWLLQRPELEELLFNAPQIGKILRPLCRMLGVEPTSPLRQPQRVPPAPSQYLDDEAELPEDPDAPFWKPHPPPKPA